MNSEYDDDYYICEDCGRKNFPEVGMSWCECKFSGAVTLESTPESAHPQKIRAYWDHNDGLDIVTVDFAYIQHQTEKAWLLAFNSSFGLAEHWVPKSLATVAGTKVALPRWLARNCQGNKSTLTGADNMSKWFQGLKWAEEYAAQNGIAALWHYYITECSDDQFDYGIRDYLAHKEQRLCANKKL